MTFYRSIGRMEAKVALDMVSEMNYFSFGRGFGVYGKDFTSIQHLLLLLLVINQQWDSSCQVARRQLLQLYSKDIIFYLKKITFLIVLFQKIGLSQTQFQSMPLRLSIEDIQLGLYSSNFSRVSINQMPRRGTVLLNLSKAFQRYCEVKLPELKKSSKSRPEQQLLSDVKRAWENMRIEEKSKWDLKLDSSVLSPAKTDKKQKREENTGIKSSTKRKNKQTHSIMQEPIESDTLKKGDRNISKKLFQDKTKKIAKQIKKDSTVQEYRTFYKFQYKKLKEDHPNWNAKKLTTVISLLWKKVKQSSRDKTQQEVEAICERIVSGREAYKERKMQEGNKDQNIEEMWQRLPVEAKRRWEQEGTGLALGRAKKGPALVKIPCSSNTNMRNPLEFMKNRIS